MLLTGMTITVDQASDGGAEQLLAVKTARRESHNAAAVARLTRVQHGSCLHGLPKSKVLHVWSGRFRQLFNRHLPMPSQLLRSR